MAHLCVLVVEDYEPLLQAICGTLQEEGYAVLRAVDGAQALQLMEKTRPDLIVSDIMMPRMDGYAFYERVRDRVEWVPIPFIFLTAKAEVSDRLRGKALGVEDYLTKPFDPQELVVAVRARLERAQAVRGAVEGEFELLKQRIVTLLSHELRTPLTYIRGYTDLALEDVPSLSPDTLQEFLRGVKHGADRLGRLVDDLLLLVQLDTGRAAGDYHLFADVKDDLGAIVEKVVEHYTVPARAAGLELQCVIEPALPPVRLFEPFFVSALERLMDNGIKFSRGVGQRLSVTVRAVEHSVHVAVQDEGMGIPKHEIPYLFQRFRQIDRERMEQQGAGLGLVIARELILLHGGDIHVRSRPRKGSTFTIALPVARTEDSL